MVTIYLLKFKTLSYKKLHFSQNSASFLLNKVYNVLIKSPDHAAALIPVSLTSLEVAEIKMSVAASLQIRRVPEHENGLQLKLTFFQQLTG